MLRLHDSRQKLSEQINHSCEVNQKEYKKCMLATEANKRITLADEVLRSFSFGRIMNIALSRKQIEVQYELWSLNEYFWILIN